MAAPVYVSKEVQLLLNALVLLILLATILALRPAESTALPETGKTVAMPTPTRMPQFLAIQELPLLEPRLPPPVAYSAPAAPTQPANPPAAKTRNVEQYVRRLLGDT